MDNFYYMSEWLCSPPGNPTRVSESAIRANCLLLEVDPSDMCIGLNIALKDFVKFRSLMNLNLNT